MKISDAQARVLAELRNGDKWLQWDNWDHSFFLHSESGMEGRRRKDTVGLLIIRRLLDDRQVSITITPAGRAALAEYEAQKKGEKA